MACHRDALKEQSSLILQTFSYNDSKLHFGDFKCLCFVCVCLYLFVFIALCHFVIVLVFVYYFLFIDDMAFTYRDIRRAFHEYQYPPYFPYWLDGLQRCFSCCSLLSTKRSHRWRRTALKIEIL